MRAAFLCAAAALTLAAGSAQAMRAPVWVMVGYGTPAASSGEWAEVIGEVTGYTYAHGVMSDSAGRVATYARYYSTVSGWQVGESTFVATGGGLPAILTVTGQWYAPSGLFSETYMASDGTAAWIQGKARVVGTTTVWDDVFWKSTGLTGMASWTAYPGGWIVGAGYDSAGRRYEWLYYEELPGIWNYGYWRRVQ